MCYVITLAEIVQTKQWLQMKHGLYIVTTIFHYFVRGLCSMGNTMHQYSLLFSETVISNAGIIFAYTQSIVPSARWIPAILDSVDSVRLLITSLFYLAL